MRRRFALIAASHRHDLVAGVRLAQDDGGELERLLGELEPVVLGAGRAGVLDARAVAQLLAAAAAVEAGEGSGRGLALERVEDRVDLAPALVGPGRVNGGEVVRRL